MAPTVLLATTAAALLSVPAVEGFTEIRSSTIHRLTPLAVAAGGEKKALIVQNKGGGHGELGFQLALVLKEEKGLDVTMLHDGGPGPKTGKEPFDSYGEAELNVVWADLSSSSVSEALEGQGPFEYVFDNWSKEADSAKPAVELAKAWDVSNYVFVSSAGMYKGASQPMKESDEVKATGQRAVEELLAAEGLPWTSFRPQYIYGPKTNKRDYIDWFFDRVVREKPLPIPNGGDQLVSLTNSVDVAKLLAAPVGNPAAVGEVFNCATDKTVGYDELSNMVGKVVGKSVTCEHYDPSKFDLPKGAFPFRNTAFYVDVSKAKSVLGWEPSSTLEEDLQWYYEDYKKLGLESGEKEFASDEVIFA